MSAEETTRWTKTKKKNLLLLHSLRTYTNVKGISQFMWPNVLIDQFAQFFLFKYGDICSIHRRVSLTVFCTPGIFSEHGLYLLKSEVGPPPRHHCHLFVHFLWSHSINVITWCKCVPKLNYIAIELIAHFRDFLHILIPWFHCSQLDNEPYQHVLCIWAYPFGANFNSSDLIQFQFTYFRNYCNIKWVELFKCWFEMQFQLVCNVIQFKLYKSVWWTWTYAEST